MTDEQIAWVSDHFTGLANGMMILMGITTLNIVMTVLVLVFG